MTFRNPSSKISIFSFYLAKMAVWWFWSTMLGTFYCGTVHILPVIYKDCPDWLMIVQRIVCYFMLAQMIVNWICIRCVLSPFKPEEHSKYMTAHASEIANGGFEIDLNQLKTRGPGSSNGTYSLPASSVRSLDGNPCKRWNRDTMYIIALHPEDPCCLQTDCNDRRRVVYPYWSWKPCVTCQVQRPPRAHHCHLCNVCVLKRDHHCFFTGCCIGLRNQRHFVVFIFWSSVAITYSIAHSLVYVFIQYLPNNSWWDIFLPLTVIRWFLGYISLLDTILVAVFYSLVWFYITALGFLAEQTRIIRKGVTSFEEENHIKVTNFNSLSENLEGVFGKRWFLNFIFPLHVVYPTQDNGVTWANIKG